jgi:hypothetical protein
MFRAAVARGAPMQKLRFWDGDGYMEGSAYLLEFNPCILQKVSICVVGGGGFSETDVIHIGEGDSSGEEN